MMAMLSATLALVIVVLGPQGLWGISRAEPLAGSSSPAAAQGTSRGDSAPPAPAAARGRQAAPGAAQGPPAGGRKTGAPAQASAPQAPASAGGSTPPAPAQAPAPQAPAAAGGSTPPAPANTTDQLIEPTGFTYAREGRRDPFVSLLRRGSDVRAGSGLRPSGLAGLGVEEITLRGTVKSHEGFVGILQGADQKTYIVRPGDRLFDGTIRTISQNDLVIVQQVNDPLSLEKQREVRKLLRQIEAN